MSRNHHSNSAYHPVLERFRNPFARWIQLFALAVFWIQPLIPTHAVYVPDDGGVQPPFYWVPTWNGDTEPSSGADQNDADGNGIPDWRDQFNIAASNGTLAWWGGGTFTIDGVEQTFLGQYHPLLDGDRDHDGIPDSLDSHPDDETNNSIYWQGGTISLNGYTYLVRAQWFAGSSSDSNYNGVPDSVETALQNWSDPKLYWWAGGTFLLNGGWSSYAGQYYYGYDTTDTDGDGIPDVIDPAVNDPWNGTQYWFGGGEWFINGILTHFEAGYHSGFWSDDDGDGLPDDIDPCRGDYNNNSSTWGGGAFYVSGSWQSFPAQYHAANIGDRDGDGIPDDIDPFPDDNSNNSFYWWGGSFTANNQGYYYPPGYYAGSGQDSDGDGIPDGIDPYPNDFNNGNYTQPTFYWSGGYFTVNNSSTYWSPGYYDGYWQDNDNDGIPDSLDAYINDPNNGNVSTVYWNGGTFTVNNQAQYWSPGDYPSLTDSDGDTIPDCVDPYINDPNNGNQSQFFWQGGSYYINGTYTLCPSGWYSGELFANAADAGGIQTISVQAANGAWLYTKDRDGDGIPDAADQFGDDPTNNTFYWYGGGRIWYVDGAALVKPSAYYAGQSFANVSDLGNIPYIVTTDPLSNVTRYVADSDGDGLPDCLDPYTSDPLNHSFYWDGGNGRVWYVDNQPTTFAAGYYNGPSSPTPGEAGGPRTLAVYDPNTMVTSYVIDQDNDGIPDDGADPHRDDPNNGTWFYWPPKDSTDHDTTLTFIINNVEHTFTSTLYGGLLVDTDGDGIPDVADIDYPGDQYNGNDSDGDGIPDSVEVQYAAYGMDMNNDADAQIVRADGLTNLQAYQNGQPLDQSSMDPALDSDHDGMSDVYEIVNGLDRYSAQDAMDAPVNHMVNANGQRDSTGAVMNDFILNVEKARAGIPLTTVITDPAQYQLITGHPPGAGIVQNDALVVAENDWDGDGISNVDEVLVFHTDPRDVTSKPLEPLLIRAYSLGLTSLTTNLRFYERRSTGDGQITGETPVLGTGPSHIAYSPQIADELLQPQLPQVIIQGSNGAELGRQRQVYGDPGAIYANWSTHSYGHMSDWIDHALVRWADWDETTGPTPTPLFRDIPNAGWPFIGYGGEFGGDAWNVSYEAVPYYESEYESVQTATVQFSWVGGAPEDAVILIDEIVFKYGTRERLNRIPHYVIFRKGQEWSVNELQINPAAGTGVALALASEVPGWTLSMSDAAGPTHRKVGLNGHPISDAAPHETEESDIPAEETYIDALTGRLHHRVSDVHVPLGASLLNLEVTRQVESEVWSRRHGFRPNERYDRPFGVNWSSNLSPYLTWDGGNYLPGSSKATVVDENGQTQSFVFLEYRMSPDETWSPVFVHSREERESAKTSGDTLTFEESGTPDGKPHYVLTKKYGTKCYYDNVDFFYGGLATSDWYEQAVREPEPTDRFVTVDPSNFDNVPSLGNTWLFGHPASRVKAYARLAMVVDRWGNELRYSYPNNTTLTPHKIYDPQRPGETMWIVQDQRGLVTDVQWPGGDRIKYSYADIGSFGPQEPVWALTSVTKQGADAQSVVHYQYDMLTEQDPTPRGADPFTLLYHTDLASIEDENHHSYAFGLSLDHTQWYEDARSDGTMWRKRMGVPRRVSSVTLPGGGVTTFGILRSLPIKADMTLGGDCSTTVNVVGPAGSFTYLFENPVVWQSTPDYLVALEAVSRSWRDPSQPTLLGPNEFQYRDPSELEQAMRSRTLVYYYTKETLLTPLGRETFTFDYSAGMAVKSATDMSGNTTSYQYGDENLAAFNPGFDYSVSYYPMGPDGWPLPPVLLKHYFLPPEHFYYDDPTAKVDALKQVTAYTYDPKSRVMDSMRLPNGVKHQYVINQTTHLVMQEKVLGANGALVASHENIYGDTQFKGFLTQKIAHRVATDPDWMHDQTTNFVPDIRGRTSQIISDPDGLALTSSVDYDLDGKKRFSTDPRNFTTEFEYDALHRLRQINYPDFSTKTYTHDAHGNLTSETNELGALTTHSYDPLNRRTSTVVDVGDETTPARLTLFTRAYNGMDLIDWEDDANGIRTSYSYDAIGRKTSAVRSGLTTSWGYEGANSGGSLFDSNSFHPISVISPKGTTTTMEYDELYRMTAKSVTDGGRTVTHYDSVGNPTSSVDPLDRTTATEFDDLNRPIKVTYPDLTAKRMSYTSTGLLWKTVDELGNATTTEYDAVGRGVVFTQPATASGSAITRKHYDAAGNVVRVVDPLGHATDTTYDSRNRVVDVKAPPVAFGANQMMRPITHTEYDLVGNPVLIKDPMGGATSKTYDKANRLVMTEDALGHKTRYKHDGNGNIIQVTDANYRTTSNHYDDQNRLTTTTDPAGSVTEFGYDNDGNRTLVRDGNLHETTFSYDGLKRVLTETDAAGHTTTHTYDALRETDRFTPNGVQFHFDYDARDRLLHSIHAGGERILSYDATGRLTDVTEPQHPEARVAYTYDAVGNTLTELSRGLTHTYEYDLAGKRIRASYGNGVEVLTDYDALNRPTNVSEGGRSTVYKYDLAGRALSMVMANGQFTSNVYDKLGRLTGRTLFGSQDMTSRIAGFYWEHDSLGNVTQQAESWPGTSERAAGIRTTDMTYDAANHLERETVTSSSGSVTETVFGYDSAGNRVSKEEKANGVTAARTTYEYDSTNQLMKWTMVNGSNATVGRAVFAYDASGNRVSSLSTDQTAHALFNYYLWDDENRLVRVQTRNGLVGQNNVSLIMDVLGGVGPMPPSSLSISGIPPYKEHSYGYDYRTRRINVTEPTGSRAIVFSGGLSVAEYPVGDSASSIQDPATATVSYQRGPDMGGGVGGLLYSLRGSMAKFNLSNGRGDIVAQSDSSGSLTWTASYEAYGKRPVETGSNLDRQRANSKEEDPTGLLNEGFRYRDIETGVWLSRDPAGFVDGPNLYAYVKQNPWTGFDPEGLETEYQANAMSELREFVHMGDQPGHKPSAEQRARFTEVGQAWIGDRAQEMAGVPLSFYNRGVYSSKAADELYRTLYPGNPGTEARIASDAGKMLGADIGAAYAFHKFSSARLTQQKTKGEVEWVSENAAMSDRARKYQAGTPGAKEGKAPRLSAQDHEGKTVTAKFDGMDGDTLVDRKLSIFTSNKTKTEALRQSAVAAENGYGVRWEVPSAKEVGRAQKMMKDLGIKNIDVKHVSE